MVLVLVFSGNNQPQHTVYPMKYAHGYVVFLFLWIVLKCIVNIYFFIHILQGCFSGSDSETVLISWFCPWFGFTNFFYLLMIIISPTQWSCWGVYWFQSVRPSVRPYMKKTKITLYEEDKKEEASMRCSLLHGSWDQILRRRPSVRPSVRPLVRPASRVRSVAPTVLVGSISYLYILSSNFRRCVVCKVSCKIPKFEFLAIFINL